MFFLDLFPLYHRLSLPLRPYNTGLVSGPVVGADQIPIWSHSCVFLPLTSASAHASACSFVGLLIVLLNIP